MIEINFDKIIGAGNDFIVLNLSDEVSAMFFADAKKREVLIQSMCHRISGVGADGLIFLESLGGESDFRWHFFNRDGSSAAMCGNAARALSRLLLSRTHLKQVKVLTQETEFVGWEEKKDIVVEFKMPMKDVEQKLKFENREIAGLWISAGVPHFIPHESTSWEQALTRKNEIQFLRSAEELGPPGANITLVEGTQSYRAITFERGVEDFTLACGTGAIAAAWARGGRQGERGRIAVTMPGGSLQVEFLEKDSVRLIGEGRFVFNGVYRQEIL